MKNQEAENYFKNLKEIIDCFGTAPLFAQMPHRNLEDKGINGPTAAHVIEQVHVPLNLAGLTFTTGSSALQNIVGITYEELEDKIAAGKKALEMAGVKGEAKMLFCYPPLVNVFTKEALQDYGIKWHFLLRSSRDAFLLALYTEEPDAVVGESNFLRVALEDAKRLGLLNCFSKMPQFLVAGTPLDLEFLSLVEQTCKTKVSDLYGCQEFGWLTVDGIPLRKDLSLIPSPLGEDYREVVVGGLPTGDSFPVDEKGHVLNRSGKVITYRRKRTFPEYEVFVKATPLGSMESIQRVARTVLRIKGRIVKVSPDVQLNAPQSILQLLPSVGILGKKQQEIVIKGCDKTTMFDTLAQSQLHYEENGPKDPTWTKRR